MDPPIVIGSGHAGFAAARKLVRLGHRPTLIDIGRTLDPPRARLIERLAAVPPREWDPTDRTILEELPPVSRQIPRRLAFGSSYVYADDDPAIPIDRTFPHAPVPSAARGGLSNVWSAAMLPAADCDLTGWPITRSDLEQHYREVLGDQPFSAVSDLLEREFPLYATPSGAVSLPSPAQVLLDRLGRRARLQASPDTVFGRARLAVDAGDGSPTSCRYCTHCLTGCAYGSISSTVTRLTDLVTTRQVDYLPNLVVRSVEDLQDRVRVHCDALDGGTVDIEGSRVFIAAGAMNTTRIVLESRNLWNHQVRLATTQGFVAPLIPLGVGPVEQARVTLAALFVELKVPGSDHWVHAQVGPLNELAVAKLRQSRWGGILAEQLGRRSMAALCNVHSDHAGHHLLELHRRGALPPLMRIETVPAPRFPSLARQVTRRLARILAASGVVVLPSFGELVTDHPISWHVGGSLPMRRNPTTPLETDRLGRPTGWQRVHIVDSAAFTSIPGTTVALLAMANATRIVAEAMAT